MRRLARETTPFSSAQALYFALVVRNSNKEGELDAWLYGSHG